MVWLVALGVVPVASAQEGSFEEAKTLNRQANQLSQQGRFTDVIPLAQRVLTIAESVDGVGGLVVGLAGRAKKEIKVSG